MSVNTCYDYVVGFSRKEDVCVTDEWDDAYAISDSGLYIDELPGMPQRFLASLGGNYNIWEKMTNARENSINAFKFDIVKMILERFEPVRKRFIGDIGYKSFTSLLSDYPYHGQRMFSDIIGGAFNLHGIYLILNVTEAVTLNIYDEYDLLYTYELQSTAGRPRYNAITPLSLPLGGNYYFIYTTTGQPYNNQLTCNCGKYHWCFDIENPCYGPSREIWTEWAMMAGIAGDDLSERDDWTTSREGAGMILHGDFMCDIHATLCSEHSDWTGNKVDFAIANAIWYKTGEFLSAYIMDTEEVSRKTLLGIKQWNNNRAYYNSRYAEMIKFIAENFEDERNECLQCKSPHGFRLVHQIL